MRLEFVGKNIKLTDSLKEQAERKLSKLDPYFSEEVEARVTFKTQKGLHTVEVTIFLPDSLIRAEETTEDMYASIDTAVDVLTRQVRKYKTRLKKRYQDNQSIRFENFEQTLPEDSQDEQGGQIKKEKQFVLQPMDNEEAILQMELLNHNFFLFRDRYTENTCLLYRRKDGHYGRIEVVE
ncbi:MAG: ribosome-associated translation inhibitor RaiA [Tissierellia bacterium]|nr:ribosome-associated translation inhibitor RaiA [Tissierellia bacterium]